jgi:4'-phosphopantetheinyl transferase
VDDESTEEVMRSWHQVRGTPPLERGAVHVWRVRVEDATQVPPSLSAEECERASRLRGRARARFIITRSALRARLAAYLDRPPESIAFRYGATGKPMLQGVGDVHFSVAHSGDVALVAVARAAPVGVDLERIRAVPRRRRVAARVLAPASAAALDALPPERQDEAFIWAWTQREAYVKAIGGGVLRSDDPLPLVWPPRPCMRAGWSIVPLYAQPGHRACLVVGGDAVPRLLDLP